MKIAPETLTKLLDLLCASPVIRHVCPLAGISEASFFEWWKRSRNSDPLFEVEWMGVRQQWADHLKSAREIYLAHLEAGFIDRMERGTDEPVYWQGRPSMMLDPQFEKWSDEDMSDMGHDPVEDRYLHDEKTGARLQHMIHHAPPTSGVLATLAAHSKKWQTKTDLNVSGKVALGVSVISRAKSVEPPLIEHVVKPPVSPHTEVPLDSGQRTGGLPIEDKSEDLPVEVPIDRNPIYTPPANSSKTPEGIVKIFSAEASDDPPEVIGNSTAAVPTMADPTPMARAPAPDIMQNAQVREAKRRIHDGLPARGPVEKQLFNALLFTSLGPVGENTEQRIQRLQELCGSHISAEDRSEGIGAGIADKPKGVKMI